MNIPTNLGNLEPQQIMDVLMYSSYRAQRDCGMDADVAAKLLKVDGDLYESRYQYERNPPDPDIRMGRYDPRDNFIFPGHS